MSVLDNFDTWKDFLASRLEQAQSQGMGQETISNMAYEVGDYLAKSTEAKNDEEGVLQDIWTAASDDERQSIASAMVKLVQNEGNTN
ncbi:DUF3243 domain-containing protein [Lentibacillus halophilus]|uniref:DUF3243 domain-containing protein n=1 Tax=Lentibacillus halophilus TaxID=295065 RepID=A0ABP3J859_9BACI